MKKISISNLVYTILEENSKAKNMNLEQYILHLIKTSINKGRITE
jgi:hypothetical protein